MCACVRVSERKREDFKWELDQNQLCVWIHKAKACVNNVLPTNQKQLSIFHLGYGPIKLLKCSMIKWNLPF